MAKTISLVVDGGATAFWWVYDSVLNQYTQRLFIAGDLFKDDCVAGDMIYLTSVEAAIAYYGNYDRVYFSITTPMVYDSIELAWEYYAQDGSWKPFPNVADGTSGLTASGTVTWDIPEDWGNGGGPGYSCHVMARVRIVSIVNVTEGGYGRPWVRNFYLSCSGGTSADPVTFQDLYDYCVNTLGRTDMIKKESGVYGNKRYIMRVSLSTSDYFKDDYSSTEWQNTGYKFDDNAIFTGAHQNRRLAGSVASFYTDNTWNSCLIISQDTQRMDKFGGAGTYNRCIFLLPTVLLSLSSGVTFNKCHFVTGSSWFRGEANATIDLRDTTFEGYFYNDKPNVKLKNFSTSSTAIYLLDGTAHLVNATYNPTTNVGGTTGYVYFDYELNLKVQDRNGTPISGARVVIKDNINTEVANVETDANGDIPTQELCRRFLTGSGVNWTYRSPHTVTISKSGYVTKVVKYTMDRKREEVEVLEQITNLNFSKRVRYRTQ